MAFAKRVFMGCCAPMALPVAQAMAQDEPQDLGTLLLNARLFEEPAREVPGRVSVRVPEDLVPQTGVDIGDVVREIPNVVLQQTNAEERFIIRGISAYNTALADPVGVIVNGVALPLGTIQVPALIALEQAAVFPGPQGAHYGRNSEAGVISLEFAAPGAEDKTRAALSFAQHDAYRGSVYFNRKVGRLGAVLALEYEDTGGQITNTVTGDNQGGERERFTGYVGASLETDSGTTIELTHLAENDEFGKEQFRYTTGFLVTPRFQSNYNTRSSEERHSGVTSLRVRHSFDAVDFTSVMGYTTFDRSFILDFDTSPLTLGVTQFDLDDRHFAQEFRLSTPEGGNGRWDWSAGVSFYTQDTDVAFNLGAFGINRVTDIEQTGFAVFGFAEYDVTDRLRLGAGARVDWNDASATQQFITGGFTNSYRANLSDVEFLPKLTAAYDVSDTALIYGSLAQGYLPGGFNYNFASSAATFTFGPEFSTTFEIGARFDWLATSFDIAAFYTEVDDKQIVQLVPGGAQRISNAAKVEIYGLEAKAKHQMTSSLSLRGAVGLQNAEATSFRTTVFGPVGPTPVDFSGNDLPFAPNMTYSLGADYDNGTWLGNLSLQGSGRFFFDPANALRQDGYATLDASIGRRIGNATVTLWATNLFDANYFTTALSTPRGNLVEDGPGRAVGFNVAVDW